MCFKHPHPMTNITQYLMIAPMSLVYISHKIRWGLSLRDVSTFRHFWNTWTSTQFTIECMQWLRPVLLRVDRLWYWWYRYSIRRVAAVSLKVSLASVLRDIWSPWGILGFPVRKVFEPPDALGYALFSQQRLVFHKRLWFRSWAILVNKMVLLRQKENNQLCYPKDTCVWKSAEGVKWKITAICQA
jgi:hypothetical protein